MTSTSLDLALVLDGYGYPLTWNAVRRAHSLLQSHASCSEAALVSAAQPFTYDSDDDNRMPCWCPRSTMSRLRTLVTRAHSGPAMCVARVGLRSV